MKRSKKSVLNGASILTIVTSCFLIILAIFCFFCVNFATEETLVDAYRADEEYTYYEDVDMYYFTYVEDGEEYVLTDEEIVFLASFIRKLFKVIGSVLLISAIAKMILAILLITKNCKNKYSFGLTLSLLIISLLSFNVIESVLLIVAMCMKDKIHSDINLEESPTKELDKILESLQ